jgi:DNA invertase Pin-like site-specific DNA recombinase
VNGPQRVAIYARVSGHTQDAAPQLARLRAWATERNWVIAHEELETVKGRLVRRPGMDRIMALVRGHRIHAVAVVKLDRWGRSLIDLRGTIEEMVECGVAFHAVESGIIYERHTAAGKLFLSQLAAFAEFEADLISDRTREGLAARRAAGVKLGRPLKPCALCGGARNVELRARYGGRRIPICGPCNVNRLRLARGPLHPPPLGEKGNERRGRSAPVP